MSETTTTASCAARSHGEPCKNAGTHQHLETENVHEKSMFKLCDEHEQAWNTGELSLFNLSPSRVTSWVE